MKWVVAFVLPWLIASPLCAAFLPGDILVNNWDDSNIEQYSSAGVLQRTFTGTGTFWEGASLTPDGNVVTTRRNPVAGINIFNPAGTEIVSFNTPQLTLPGDVSVFPDGTLAVSDQNGANIKLYTQGGTYLTSLTLPTASNPWGNAISPVDASLWVADSVSRRLFNVTQAGVVLHTLPLSFQPADLAVDSAGTLWVARWGTGVEHMSASGTTLGSFTIGSSINTGLTLGLDGSIYVTPHVTFSLNQYASTGTLLHQYSMPNGPTHPMFLSTVPIPEPTGALAILLSGTWLLSRRGRVSSSGL